MPDFAHQLHGEALRCCTSAEWIDYFQQNRVRPRPIPWDEGVALSATEQSAVVRSIQIFQLGESGQGKHFFRAAQQYAERVGEQGYLTALAMFLDEEHRHADELGRILDVMGRPRLQKEWTDNVFRWLRHRAGLELMIIVLLTGEVIAQVYYGALRRATQSPLLRRLCEQILADEAAHVRFQAERLALIRRGHSRRRLTLTALCERLLFRAACLVVWRGHRAVFRAAGFSFCIFWSRAHAAFRRSLPLRDPRSYAEPTGLKNAPANTQDGNIVCTTHEWGVR